MVSVLNFSFWTVWSSDSAGRRSVREHAGRQSGIAWRGRSGGYDPCRRQTVQKKNERRRRIGAPLRFPAPPRMGMAGHGPLSESSRSGSGGSVIPGALGPGRVGSGGSGAGLGSPRGGALGIGSQQDVQHGFFPSAEHFAVSLRVLWSAGGQAGRPVVSAWCWFAVSSGSATGRRGWRPRLWRRDCIPRRLPARASRLAWRARPPSTTVCS